MVQQVQENHHFGCHFVGYLWSNSKKFWQQYSRTHYDNRRRILYCFRIGRYSKNSFHEWFGNEISENKLLPGIYKFTWSLKRAREQAQGNLQHPEFFIDRMDTPDFNGNVTQAIFADRKVKRGESMSVIFWGI